MVRKFSWFTLLLLLGVGCLTGIRQAQAADGVLYEVAETVSIRGGGALFKTSSATLTGALRPGTPLCPDWLADYMNAGHCSIVVHAKGQASDDTGTGPASATFSVVVQDRNTYDGPESVVMRGQMHGTIDLSPAFLRGLPLGSIGGRYSARGVPGSIMDGFRHGGRFAGVFRLPFLVGDQVAYLLDDGQLQGVDEDERSIGTATVRLEVTFVE